MATLLRKCFQETSTAPDRYPFTSVQSPIPLSFLIIQQTLRSYLLDAEKGDLSPPPLTHSGPKPPTAKPILPMAPRGHFGALHIHPLELARQITLMDHELLCAIEPWEFFQLVPIWDFFLAPDTLFRVG